MAAIREARREATGRLHGILAERGVAGLAGEATGGGDDGFVDRVLPVLADGSLGGRDLLDGEFDAPDAMAFWRMHHASGEAEVPLSGQSIAAFAETLMGEIWHDRHPSYGTGRSVRDAFGVILHGEGWTFAGEASYLDEAARLISAAPASPVPR
jgi:hypothetical protein